jgi:hypothetical protein
MAQRHPTPVSYQDSESPASTPGHTATTKISHLHSIGCATNVPAVTELVSGLLLGVADEDDQQVASGGYDEEDQRSDGTCGGSQRDGDDRHPRLGGHPSVLGPDAHDDAPGRRNRPPGARDAASGHPRGAHGSCGQSDRPYDADNGRGHLGLQP